MEWQAGSISNGSVTILNTLNMTTSSDKFLFGGHLINIGTANWQAGDLRFNSLSQVTNSAGAVFDIQGDFNQEWTSGGQPTLTNLGTFQKSAGAGTATLDLNVANSGTIASLSGTLDFTLTYVQTLGSTLVDAGANLTSSILLINGGSFGGDGTVNGNVTCAATLVLGQSPGDLTIVGDVTLQSSATVQVEIEGLAAGTEYDQLNVSGQVILAGTLNVDTSGFTTSGGQSFSLITSSGGISGAFTTIQDNPPGGQDYQYGVQAMDFVMDVIAF
jgi:hypothetical protein